MKHASNDADHTEMAEGMPKGGVRHKRMVELHSRLFQQTGRRRVPGISGAGATAARTQNTNERRMMARHLSDWEQAPS
jgi:hypothetical protein